jgi:Zn ribbon nucleic-acid-binding protein
MLYKSCPRCHKFGQLYIENDVTGKSEVCIACGYRREISNRLETILSGKRGPRRG